MLVRGPCKEVDGALSAFIENASVDTTSISDPGWCSGVRRCFAYDFGALAAHNGERRSPSAAAAETDLPVNRSRSPEAAEEVKEDDKEEKGLSVHLGAGPPSSVFRGRVASRGGPWDGRRATFQSPIHLKCVKVYFLKKTSGLYNRRVHGSSCAPASALMPPPRQDERQSDADRRAERDVPPALHDVARGGVGGAARLRRGRRRRGRPLRRVALDGARGLVARRLEERPQVGVGVRDLAPQRDAHEPSPRPCRRGTFRKRYASFVAAASVVMSPAATTPSSSSNLPTSYVARTTPPRLHCVVATTSTL